MYPFIRKIISLLCLFCLVVLTVFSGSAKAQSSLPGQPKLVVLLVIDQFCYDYLSRYHEHFSAGGFKYLIENSANFLNCHYKQASAQTAVGHSIIASGAYPWSTGIVANSWYSKRKEKEVEATEDDTVQLVGGNGPGASCRTMGGTTVGDELKLATNGRSKVICCSIKDRAALFLSGRMANGAFWFDTHSGHFVSSSQFGGALPAWVSAFNDRHYADNYFAKPWQRLLPENLYTASTKDDYIYEHPLNGDGRVFPHIISGGAAQANEQFYQTFEQTPFANQMLADFAREAIDKEGMGTHENCDLLGISFSSTDLLAHAFGPNSQEMEDMFLRLDQTLASFFQYLEQRVGLANCLVICTGDHGGMPIPELLKDKGLDAGRIDPKALSSLLEAALNQKLGTDNWIADFRPPNLYFNRNTIAKQKVRKQDVEDMAAQAAEAVPGVGDVYTAFQFYMNQLPPLPNNEAVKRSYYVSRSGDLYILPRPGYIFSSEPNGTNHGTPFRYDSQVPLLIMGPGVRSGRYLQECSPADIAPTIAAILQVNAPSLSEGRILGEALAPLVGPSRPLGLLAPQ